MHRPRGGGAVLTEPPLPQAWVPRVVNGALALFLLLFLSPLVTNFGGKPAVAQVVLVLLVALVLLFVTLCGASALRPGSVGRFFRRLRRPR